MSTRTYELSPTTQGPLYPPSEALDQHGNFVVVGKVNRHGALGPDAPWGAAIVPQHDAPPFGQHRPYPVSEELDLTNSARLDEIVLHTLPLPLPTNNYDMVFAPEQKPGAHLVQQPSYPLNGVPYPDERAEDGPRRLPPITLRRWLEASGELTVSWTPGRSEVEFAFAFSGLLPESIYTVMTLREWDLRPENPSRPGPLGIPNLFVTRSDGTGEYRATLPNPFPREGNRVINVVLLWMSEQRNYAGTIGFHGLGGDVHAQLKIRENTFYDINPA